MTINFFRFEPTDNNIFMYQVFTFLSWTFLWLRKNKQQSLFEFDLCPFHSFFFSSNQNFLSLSWIS